MENLVKSDQTVLSRPYAKSNFGNGLIKKYKNHFYVLNGKSLTKLEKEMLGFKSRHIISNNYLNFIILIKSLKWSLLYRKETIPLLKTLPDNPEGKAYLS